MRKLVGFLLTLCFLCGAAPAFADFATARKTIKIQRIANPSFEVSTWAAFDQNDQEICQGSTPTTVSACLAQAVNVAFPYVLGATAPGYDLEILGGMDPAPNNTVYSGAAVLIPMSSALVLNPMQGGRVLGQGLTLGCNLVIDSIEFSEIRFEGSQVSPCGGGDPRNGLVLKSQHPTPLDQLHGSGPGHIFVQSVNGGMHVDMTSGGLGPIDVYVSELNTGGIFTSGCAYLSDTASAANNFFNHIRIDYLHGFRTAGMTAMCIGTAFESNGFINGYNKYDVTINPDIANVAVNGIDTYGHDDKWTIVAANMQAANYIIKFEAGSCRNNVDIVIQGTAPSTIVNDQSGCPLTNTVLINGQLYIGNLLVSQNVASPFGFTFPGGVVAAFVGADGAGTGLDVDAYNNGSAGSAGSLTFRTARGTGASPANLSSGDTLAVLAARPYTNGAFTSVNPARIAFIYNDTSPNFGTFIEIDTTPAGSQTRAQAMRLMAGVIIGTGTTDPGANNLAIGGNLTIGGITGATQCLHVNSSGVVSGTGSDCGSGGSAGVSSLGNATSDTTLTITGTGTGPWTGIVTAKINLSNPNTWSGLQTYNTGDLAINGGTATAGLATVTSAGVVSSEANATVAQGGTNCTSASGTCLDNITGFSSTGLIDRTGAGTYTFTAPGTGVLTALGTNVGSAGAFVVNGGALGTPSSGTLTNATGLPISSGVSGLGTGVATALAAAVDTNGGLVTGSTTSIAAGAIVAGGGSGSAVSGVADVATGSLLASGGVGSNPSYCHTCTLGASGTLGSLAFGNATSGLVTLQPVTGALGSVTASLPANTGTIAETNFAQIWSALQTFNTGDLAINGGTATAGLATVTAAGVVSSEANATVAQGGTNCTSASGTCLDNITGFSSTGLIDRTGAGTYSFTAPGTGVLTALGNNIDTNGGIVTASTASIAAGAIVVGGGSGSAVSGVADVATGSFLTSGGVGSNPGYSSQAQSWQLLSYPFYTVQVGSAVNFNSVGDNSVSITLPTGISNYRIQAGTIYNCSASITTAQFALFTAASGGGFNISGTTTGTVTASAAATASDMQLLATSSAYLTSSTLFFRISTAQGSAATCAVDLSIIPLP